jgi:hypothetical protein
MGTHAPTPWQSSAADRTGAVGRRLAWSTSPDGTGSNWIGRHGSHASEGGMDFWMVMKVMEWIGVEEGIVLGIY